MAANQTWSFEHIQHILARLDTNHINTSINANDFEETRALDTIYQVQEDPFKDFDEFVLQPYTHSSYVPKVANGLLALTRCLMQNANLSDVKLFINTLKMYIDATLVKDLHITKYKLTKKKLKEDLEGVDVNIQNNIWAKDNLSNVAKSLLVAFSRCYQCNIRIEGIVEIHIECPNTNTHLHLKLNEDVCTCETH